MTATLPNPALQLTRPSLAARVAQLPAVFASHAQLQLWDRLLGAKDPRGPQLSVIVG